MKAKMSKKEFLIRSLTLGLPVNAGGAVIALAMMATGHFPKKYENCLHFEIGTEWGGCSAGMFIFTCKDAPDSLKSHELGHSIQNCYYGPLMPIVVNLPSTLRALGRNAVHKIRPEIKLPDYYSAWFEAEASSLGRQYFESKD